MYDVVITIIRGPSLDLFDGKFGQDKTFQKCVHFTSCLNYLHSGPISESGLLKPTNLTH